MRQAVNKYAILPTLSQTVHQPSRNTKKILASIKFAKMKEESINMQQGAVLQLHQEQSVLDVSNSN